MGINEELRRRKKQFYREKPGFLDKLSHELRRSVTAILLLGVGILLILARLQHAGPAGRYLYLGLWNIFGWGYYLLPLMAFVLAVVFLANRQLEWLGPPFLGAVIFIIASLGLIDIIFPGKGGLVGKVIGVIETPLGYTAALVTVGAVMLAALVVAINLPIQIKPKPKEEKKLDTKDVDKAVQQAQPVMAAAVAAAPPPLEPKPAKKEDETELKPKKIPALKDYVAPPLSLLNAAIEQPTAGDLRANANIIKRTMDSFGIPVEMGEINIGPKFTRYTLKPAEGVRLNRITALNQDLALALASHPIRIEAPIPGKSLIGIEMPNKTAATVRLGSLMNYPEFNQSGLLTVLIGRDVNGNPIPLDIARLPHLLVAGSTGSGKSVALHSILTSLLYKNSPRTLQMILIDPKKVELSSYNGVPHLIAPVVTEGKKAIGVFRWAISEMERRYEVLLKSGSRDISSYNIKNTKEPIPYLLVVVDELADLMTAYGKDVETAVVRLAQMARATGIHLLLSTQRPSVEVVTGLIKANITCRLAMQVASQIDSRTILDTAGAEKLLGGGDMLLISPEHSKPKRIQGAYISEKEVQAVTEFIEKNNKPREEEEFVPAPPPAPSSAPTAASGDGKPDKFEQFAQTGEEDPLYEEAVNVIRQAQKASASLLQRRLSVGYARAARLLDIMEERGAVGPGEGAKPREVFLSKPEGAPELTDNDADVV